MKIKQKSSYGDIIQTHNVDSLVNSGNMVQIKQKLDGKINQNQLKINQPNNMTANAVVGYQNSDNFSNSYNLVKIAPYDPTKITASKNK